MRLKNVGCEGCYYNDKALKHINITFKFSQIGYEQGFYEGQMQERKYWKDKIKAKINELEKEQKEIKNLAKRQNDLIDEYENELLEKNNYIFQLENKREALHKLIDEEM